MRPLSVLLAFLFAVSSITLSTAASALITVGALETSGSTLDIEVVGGLTYFGSRVIDVSNPFSPAEVVGSWDTPDRAYGVAVSGSYAYVAWYRHVAGRGNVGGLQVVDVSDPASPASVGSVDSHDSARSITVSGSEVFIADRSAGLMIAGRQCP